MTNFIDLTIVETTVRSSIASTQSVVEPLEEVFAARMFIARILDIIGTTPRKQRAVPCHAMTKKGVQCRNYASDGQQVFCYRHRTYMKNLRMTHLRRVFRAAVNMIIVHKRYINDYYMPGGKGAKMAAIEFKAMA